MASLWDLVEAGAASLRAEYRGSKVGQLEPGERFIVDGFGQGFVISQHPISKETRVFLEVDTRHNTTMMLPEFWEVRAGRYGKDPRLEQYLKEEANTWLRINY